MRSHRVPCHLALVALVVFAACDDNKTRYGDEDFVWGFGVDDAAQLRAALVAFHMAEDDADCAVATIFVPDFQPDPTYGAKYTVSANLLDVAIETCAIDTSSIWRSWD